MIRRSPEDRLRRDAGAVFVEFALVVPLLVLFTLGLVEYGLGWKWANDVNAAVRDGARTGTSEPAYLTSDRSILLSIGTSLTSEELKNLQKVIVFKSSNADGAVPQNCKVLTNNTGSTASPGSRQGVGNSCNVYGLGQVKYVLSNPTSDGPWINTASNGCDSGDVDWYWCPAKRSRSLTTGTFDYIGVYIQVKKPSVTNSGFGTMTIERSAVFQLEPAFGGGS